MIYKQMKAKFKLNVFREDGHGKGKPGYVQKEYKIQDIVEGPEAAFLHENMNIFPRKRKNFTGVYPH